MTKIDFTNAGDLDEFEPVPEGIYSCRVEDVEEKQTAGGHPLWRLQFAITEGVHAGRFLWDNLVFSPKALGRSKHALEAFGVDASGTVDLSAQSLVGYRCRLSVYITDWEGKQRNAVHFRGYESADAIADGTPF